MDERPNRRLLGRYEYDAGYRTFEFVCLGTFAAFGSILVGRVVNEIVGQFGFATALRGLIMAVTAFAVADLLSGLVHCLCDNLGSVDTPLVGDKFIRPFREHHDDPLAMTRGDFVEVNADNFLVCLPVLIPCVIWLEVGAHLSTAIFLAVLMAFVCTTNEVHKRAHTDRVPAAVRALQQSRLILSPTDHGRHHTAPFDSYYCISSGVLNRALTRIGFWPALLRMLRTRPAGTDPGPLR